MSAGTAISGMSEAGVLDVLYSGLGERWLSGEHVVLSGGDDAAILSASSGSYVVSTDTMIEGQDFLHRWPNGTAQPAQSIGFKAIAQNVSDINAMGAETTGVFISLSVPSSTTTAWIREFGQGVSKALAELGAEQAVVAGGDLGHSPQIAITVTVTGELTGPPLLRSQAQEGDVIYVAGNLGKSAAGLEALLSEKSLENHGHLIQDHFFPRPPLGTGGRATDLGVKCGMDISDGLLKDLDRILNASGKHLGAQLDTQELIPFANYLRDAAQALHKNAWEWVLSGGEDYGLLVTAPKHILLPPEFHSIGRVIALGENGGPQIQVTTAAPDDASEIHEVLTGARQGWDHFG